MNLVIPNEEIVIHWKATARNRDGSIFRVWPSITLDEFYALKREHKGKTWKATKLYRPGYLPRAGR